MTPPDELDAVRARYARRTSDDPRYSLLNPAALAAWQERQRAIAALFRRLGWHDLSQRRLVEVGCGTGGLLLDALQFGFVPAHLTGLELLTERATRARERLPAALRVLEGDAGAAPIAPASQDVVLQSTVFSSLLDDTVQQTLADTMWRWVRPGGGVLWYDFTVNNPRNPDVRGVPLTRVRALFPQGRIEARRLTLAPPLARALVRLHPSAYTVANAVPLLRTHILAWIAKPA
ncbi:class I SAM-dependent methyltransferase [Caldimonas caldifontis]|uniref:SAM-dependent methyltransferase n=1 Tax=Caldimonas caldifontis TaxID=1452508 RepID=A0A2S5SYX0_9BURK|nr:class I SAM-dependent methyltransferase [Caldimonas caldifontis]PPE67955.1 SAM-dependent methyltransferase [Caldimonas caldifontis]